MIENANAFLFFDNNAARKGFIFGFYKSGLVLYWQEFGSNSMSMGSYVLMGEINLLQYNIPWRAAFISSNKIYLHFLSSRDA